VYFSVVINRLSSMACIQRTTIRLSTLIDQ